MDDEGLDTSYAADTNRDTARDVSDVIAGPIGSAHLVDPSKAEANGTDLDGFPVIVPPPDTTRDDTTADADAEPPA